MAIPEFNTRFTRGMLMDTLPKDFNTLVRLSGFSHGTDVWLGNARELIVSGTASVLETVGCRDDIMLYLISMGLDPKMSFKIMEAVRKGKVKKGGFQTRAGWRPCRSITSPSGISTRWPRSAICSPRPTPWPTS